MRYQRARWLGLALGALLVLPACSAREGSGPVSVTTPYERVTPTAGASSERPSAQSDDEPAHNDLKKGRVTRSLKAGTVKVNVKYSLRNPVQEWSPGVAQPLTISMTASAQQGTGQYTASTNQKIYLSRLTAYLDVSDPTGYLDSPDPLIDKADITPGFFVTTPSSYSQVFALPSLPDEATRLTIEFSYEMLVLQSNSTPRDFSKRTATDTLVISLP